MDEAVPAPARPDASGTIAHERLEQHKRRTHPHRHHHHGWWWKTLAAGLALWVVTVAVTALTLNSNLIPTLILLGSFLVPFCVMLFVLERITGSITTLQVIIAFFIGGICGVLGASLLEAGLAPNLYSYLGIGFIEEFVKGVLLIIIGWRVIPKSADQGALLGATIGAGFAAFESAGYAFNAAITAQGIVLETLLQTEILRAILAPVGHILWTAILGAAIFGAARGRSHFRLSFGILGAFVGVSLLHALWDSSSGLTALLALLLTGTSLQQLEFGFISSKAASGAEILATVLYIIAMAVIALVGIVALWLILRHQRRAVGNEPASASSTASTPVLS